MRLFLLGPSVADDMAICDLGALGYFVPVYKKQVLVPWMSPSLCKRRPISLYIPLLRLSFSGPFIWCRCSWAFNGLGQMTLFALPGCNIISPVAWSITAQSSPCGYMSGSGLMNAEVVVLMVSTWFYMMSCPWRRHSRVLYMCTCVTLGFYFAFWCAAGGICSVSLGIMWGARLGGHLCARPG